MRGVNSEKIGGVIPKSATGATKAEEGTLSL